MRPGGRIGLVLPSGVASDAGAAPLRRFLFDRADVDDITGLDNRDAIFPIHRSVRFVLLDLHDRPAHFGHSMPVRDLTRRRAGTSDDDGSDEVTLTRAFLSRLSGSDDLGIPELGGEADLRLLERISASCPRLGVG